MSNQTIAQIPYDLTDTGSLNRFLRELVDNLDIVLGYKGTSEGYVSTAEQTLTLETLRKQLTDLTETSESNEKSLEELKTSLEELVSQVETQNTLKTKPALGAAYNDFNSAGWQTLAGKYTLAADGGVLLNTPFIVTAGTLYEVFIDSTETNSVVHQQISVGKTTVQVYTRWGVGNTWTKLG